MSQTPGKPPRKPVSYRDAGVDIDAGDELVRRIKPLVAATSRPEVLGGLGGFGGLFHLGERFRDPVLVSGTDGVGTKLLLARALETHDTIGIDLVAMCVNDILVTGAEPLFFLDYFACGRLDPERAAAVVAGIAEGCRQAGCALIGGETAEMPGMYGDGEYDLAGFAVGAVERDRLIDGSGIDDNCVLVGIASSGPHSNGYSLIRRILDAAGTEGAGQAAALLEPTRIYADAVAALTATMDVRGLAHITGGGLTDNIIRILPDGLGIEIDPSAWDTPEVFRWIAESGPVEAAEMRRTFNMGVGLVAVVPADRAGEVAALIGEAAPVIGRVVPASGSGPRVTYRDS